MYRGYVKLWRKTVESRVFKDPNLLKVWVWCLTRANHTGKWVSVESGRGTTEVWVESGQFIFGRESAAKELAMKPSSVRNRINKLKSIQNVDIKADRQYSIITIMNWNTYQSDSEKVDSDKDSEVDSRRTAVGQPKDTNKNDKNEKNKTYSAEFDRFWSAYPNKIGKKPSWEKWKRMNGTRPDIKVILSAIEKQKRSRKWKEGYIPNPLTWLNQERWSDEVAPNLFSGSESPPYWEEVG